MPSVYVKTPEVGVLEPPYFPQNIEQHPEPIFSTTNETSSLSNNGKDPAVALAERRRVQLWNLIQTGFAYMFLLSSVQTALSVGTVVLNNVDDDMFEGTPTLGYTVLGSTYCVLAVAYWIAQPIVAKLGSINSMVISSVCFIFFLLSFIRPLKWLLYLAAIVAGFGSAVLSTAGGVFMALNSDSETIGRNTGLFFGLYETSLIWGNIGFFSVLRGSDGITNTQRYEIFGFLLALAVIGTILVMLLYRKQAKSVLQPSEFARAIDRGFWESLQAAGKLCFDVNIIMMVPLIIFLGLSSAFRNDIYNTSIGYTLKFHDLSLVGLAGVMLGVGELTGSAICAGINIYMPHLSRGKIVAGGIVVNYLAYLLIYFNIPTEANLAPTYSVGVIDPPNEGLAVFCSFLMGIGDASFNTQIYAILAEMFGRDIVPPVGLFQSLYAIFCAIAYFYSTAVKLYAQMLILILTAFLGALSFGWMAGRFSRTQRYEDI